MKIRELFLFCFTMYMFTINLEDGREAPYKASISKTLYYNGLKKPCIAQKNEGWRTTNLLILVFCKKHGRVILRKL